MVDRHRIGELGSNYRDPVTLTQGKDSELALGVWLEAGQGRARHGGSRGIGGSNSPSFQNMIC